MSSVGIGILGAGWVAGEHLKSFDKNAGSHVVGICSRTVDGASRKAKEVGMENIRVYNSYKEMLDDPNIAAVSICTPPNQHPDQVIQAADAGKAILIEKAVANDPASLGRMLKSVRSAQVLTVVSFVLHWNPEFIWIRKMIDDDMIGKIFYAEVDYWHEIGPWYGQYRWNIKKEIAGSTFLSAGCHAVDALRWFVADEPEEVVAYSNQINAEYEYPTNTVGILKFSGGAIGKVSSLLDCKCPYAFNIDLLGEKGTIRDNHIFSKANFPGATDWITVPTVRPDSGDVSHHPFDGEIAHFTDSVVTGTPSSLDLEDAAKTHAICYALDRSAAEHRPVKLDEIWRDIA